MKTSDEITKIVFQKMADYKAMRKKQLIKYTSIISVFLVAIIAVFLFNINPTTQTPEIEGSGDIDTTGLHYYETENPDFEAFIEYGFDISYNLAEMVENSDLILRCKAFFVREYVDGLSEFKTDTHTNNKPLKASEGFEYIETLGGVYRLSASEVIKGEKEDSVFFFNQSPYDNGGSDFYTYNGYNLRVYNPYIQTIRDTEEYILFLKKDEVTGYYMFATSPSVIYISNGKAYLHSNLTSDYSKTQYTILTDESWGITDTIIKINMVYPVIEDTISGTDVDELINTIKELTK